jgi:hypothetical protein
MPTRHHTGSPDQDQTADYAQCSSASIAVTRPAGQRCA